MKPLFGDGSWNVSQEKEEGCHLATKKKIQESTLDSWIALAMKLSVVHIFICATQITKGLCFGIDIRTVLESVWVYGMEIKTQWTQSAMGSSFASRLIMVCEWN